MLEDKVIIEVGMNEETLRAANPNVPYTAEELAADARRCLDAGAAAVHYHTRDPLTHRGTYDIETNITWQRAVTEATPLIAYPTYGGQVPVNDGYTMVSPPAEVRFRHFVAGVESGVRFEVGPIDLGAFYDFNAIKVPGLTDSEIPGWSLTRGHQLNHGYDHLWLCQFCEKYGLTKSFAAPDTMCVINLRNLIDMGLVPDEHISLKLFFFGGTALDTRFRGMLALTNELFTDKQVRWMPVVQAADGLPLTAQALSLGGDVRTGIGDYAYAAEGAPSNAELVERVVAMARALGREPATPDEARQIKGMKPLGATVGTSA